MVMISTDKAVNPASVMGATKRLAELVTLAADDRRFRTSVVRFGNLLLSSGSFLTIALERIHYGRPLPITNPDATRYFMTVEEAVELVIQAGAVGREGEVLVLDMGDPVRISDVASQMIAASGRSVEIVYTGLRPGEKLNEELFDEHDTECGRRAHAQITAVTTPTMELDEVGDLLEGRSNIGVRTRLRELCQRQLLPSVAERIAVDEDVVDHVVGL